MRLPLRASLVQGRTKPDSYSGKNGRVTSPAFRRCSERKPADQLNLARSAGGGEDLACVSGEITRRVLEDGIAVTSHDERILRITRNTKIRVVEHVISFHPNRNLPSLGDPKIFVDRRVELREPRPAQMFRPALPNSPGVGTANALGLNQHDTVPALAPFGQTPVSGLPTRFGRSGIISDWISALSKASTGVNGSPL
jgi:hypothetical protein